MKKLAILFTLFLLATSIFASNDLDTEAVEKASMNYIDGFYEGDSAKLKASLDPTLNKFGFWLEEGAKVFKHAGSMSFEEAIKYAENVKAKKEFPKADAPKKVEVIEVSNKIAITKVTAWWGIDYMLLAKNDGKWMIRQVLWEGPSTTANPTEADREAVKKGGIGYIEGFYEGDTAKLENSLKPTMYKYGYGYSHDKGEFGDGGQMKFEEALAFAKRVKESKRFPAESAPKKVEVLDVMNHIAAVKITAWWGIDYMLLSKTGDKWMIEQVLWSGIPPSNS